MLQELDVMDPCTGNNWYLYSNKEVDENEVIELEVEGTRELEGFDSAFSRKGRTSEASIPTAKLGMLTFGKQDRSKILK